MRVHRNCCGLDVHKKMIAACLIREDAEGNSVTGKRLFGSMTRELHELAQWLRATEHYKAVRGKKTDLKDGTRIAELLRTDVWKAAMCRRWPFVFCGI